MTKRKDAPRPAPDGVREDISGRVVPGRPPHASDDAAVTALGYVQRLDRSLSNFALFALQFSYMSVVATWILLFGFG